MVLVKGAVPGPKGGWVLVRDALKRPLPEGVPFPGALRTAAAPEGEAPAEDAAEVPAEAETPSDDAPEQKD